MTVLAINVKYSFHYEISKTERAANTLKGYVVIYIEIHDFKVSMEICITLDTF